MMTSPQHGRARQRQNSRHSVYTSAARSISCRFSMPSGRWQRPTVHWQPRTLNLRRIRWRYFLPWGAAGGPDRGAGYYPEVRLPLVVSRSPVDSRNEATPKPCIIQEHVDAFARNVHYEGDITSRVPARIDEVE